MLFIDIFFISLHQYDLFQKNIFNVITYIISPPYHVIRITDYMNNQNI